MLRDYYGRIVGLPTDHPDNEPDEGAIANDEALAAESRLASTTFHNDADRLVRESAYNDALGLIELGCEVRSAFKEAASEAGIAWGDAMGAFIVWAEARLAA
jgi:hypothetical protein